MHTRTRPPKLQHQHTQLQHVQNPRTRTHGYLRGLGRQLPVGRTASATAHAWRPHRYSSIRTERAVTHHTPTATHPPSRRGRLKPSLSRHPSSIPSRHILHSTTSFTAPSPSRPPDLVSYSTLVFSTEAGAPRWGIVLLGVTGVLLLCTFPWIRFFRSVMVAFRTKSLLSNAPADGRCSGSCGRKKVEAGS